MADENKIEVPEEKEAKQESGWTSTEEPVAAYGAGGACFAAEGSFAAECARDLSAGGEEREGGAEAVDDLAGDLGVYGRDLYGAVGAGSGAGAGAAGWVAATRL